MLHELGDERFATDSEHALITRRPDGTFMIALWNYVSPGADGPPITIALRLPEGARTIRLRRLDASHGDVRGAYAQMGSPQYPTHEQLEALRSSSALGAPEELSIVNHQVSITLPPNALVTAEVLLR